MSESINSKQEAIEGVVQARFKNLVEFLEEIGHGSLKQAKALWVINRVHLSEHPQNFYFRNVIDGGIITVNGDGTFDFVFNPFRQGARTKSVKSVASPSKLQQEYKRHLNEAALGEKIRSRMTTEGPCKDECIAGEGTDCRNCGIFRNMKNKTWLEET